MINLELPDLPYSKDALMPYMSAETLELHHDKHHMAYITNGNNAPVFNNVAQHINHVHFWEVMKNNPDGKIPSELENKIVSDIGSIEKMKEDFINAGIGQFGSGWCWLVLNNGKLEITKTPNGENPIVHGHTPLLGCDVWEHSYYVDYRNRRPDYLKAFIDNLVNWEKVTENLNNA